jgi:hypothetical protein
MMELGKKEGMKGKLTCCVAIEPGTVWVRAASSRRGISATVLATTWHCQRPNHEPGEISYSLIKSLPAQIPFLFFLQNKM